MDQNRSGVGEYVTQLLDNLFKIDQTNQYKLFYNSFRSVAADLPKWDYPNVRFYGWRLPNKLLSLSFLFLGWPKIDKLIGGCDVFIIPNLCYFSLSKGCHQVGIVHDLSFELYKEFYKRKWRLSYWLINARNIFKRADQLVAVSQNTKDDLIKCYGIAEEKIEVIYPGVREPVLPDGGRQQLVNLPERFILMLGTREPRKNLIGIVRAFERIKTESGDLDLGLVIAGGSGWLNAAVDRAIKKSNFKKDIKVLGYVSEEVKTELYRQADVFIYPSFYEGFGFSPLEAMQQGCPVITSLSPATAEIAGGAALLVNPYNISEMAEAIEKITNYELRIKDLLINKGLERAKGFNWETTARKVLDLINSFEFLAKS